MTYMHETDPVEMSSIYPDDSVEVAWYKLSEHYRCLPTDICLFAKKKVSLTPEQIFKTLSEETGTIPWFHYVNFSHNFEPYFDVSKEPVTLDVISRTSFVDVTMLVSLGQKMLLPANPDLAEHISEYGETPLYKQDSKKLLLDYFPLLDETIYVCFKGDFPKTPMYYQHVIDTEYIKRRLSGMSDIYKLTSPVPMERIASISCTLSPLLSLSISLDTLFSILHVSEHIPMIQYNTGSADTLLYKLYTEEVDIAGHKIPFLPASKILKQDQSYTRSITVFFKDHVKMAFKEDGSVIFDVICKRDSCTLEDVERKIKQHTNTFELVQHFMEQSGYDYPSFISIEACTDIKLAVYFEFTVQDKMKPHNCRHKFFITLDKEDRYIRVSEFEESKIMYEVCLTLLLNNTSVDKILNQLQETFSMTREQATTIWKTYEESLQTLKSKNENKKLSIKEKEGFTSILQESQNVVSIEIRDIPSLHYLPDIRRNVRAYVALCTVPNKITCSKMEVRTVPVQELVMDIDALEIESDEEVLEISDDEMRGGAIDKDLILKNDSFLITRIKSVFATDEKFKEKEFTKKCPLKRCPIALTESESKNEYVQRAPSFEMNHRTFVCPKYWDMQYKLPLTDADLKSESHRHKRIIDKKTVKEKRTIDFTTDGTILELETGDYPYPGLLAKAYGPCCFKLNPSVKKGVKKPVIEALQRIIEDRNRPMEESKVARLPKPLQYFFGLPETCMMEKNNYLLRYGVPSPHSFIDCIVACCMMSYKKEFPTRQHVIKGIHRVAEKNFKKLNNGRLSKQFTLSEFKSGIELMDYTYLWEIVSILLNMNLVVFRIPNETDVELICPSNRYMITPFNPKKLTFFLLERNKRETKFEPIIEHNIQRNDHTLLHEYTSKINPTFKEIESHYAKCKPHSEYYSTNMTADVMYQHLHPHYKVRQILHDEMCIGLCVRQVFIPCYPSIPLEDVPKVDIDDSVSSYKHTLEVLNDVSDFCPCAPRFKVVADGVIHGIITQTNAYVPCIQEKNRMDELPLYRGKVEHEYTSMSKTQDATRIRKYRESEAEKYCYMEFRRRVKDTLHRNPVLRQSMRAKMLEKSMTEEDVHTILPEYTSLPSNEESLEKIMACKKKYCSDIFIPEINFVSGQPNQYFSRMATELNRYKRISTFIFNPQLYIPETPFVLHEHEMILVGHSAELYLDELKEPRRFQPNYDNAVAFHQEKTTDIIVKKLSKITIPPVYYVDA